MLINFQKTPTTRVVELMKQKTLSEAQYSREGPCPCNTTGRFAFSAAQRELPYSQQVACTIRVRLFFAIIFHRQQQGFRVCFSSANIDWLFSVFSTIQEKINLLGFLTSSNTKIGISINPHWAGHLLSTCPHHPAVFCV